jgi:hypothetical protein
VSEPTHEHGVMPERRPSLSGRGIDRWPEYWADVRRKLDSPRHHHPLRLIIDELEAESRCRFEHIDQPWWWELVCAGAEAASLPITENLILCKPEISRGHVVAVTVTRKVAKIIA